MDSLLSIHWVLIIAIWYFGNGILHDIFVLIKHKEGYNIDLLRLLMDGHILMLSGVIVFVCYIMMLNKIEYGGFINIIIGVSMLIYCGMIFPFLKSIGTIIVSIILIIVSIKAMNSFPDISLIMKNYK